MVNTWDPVDYYGVERWSDNYFSINSLGNVCAEPHGRESSTNIDLFEIVQEALSQGVEFPAVIRFHDILRTQVSKINQAFLAAINNCAYRGTYCGVFPIKVNQMREVVEEIVDAGARFNYGLEAGSKAELLAVLAYNSNAGSLTILNGYKDRDYMRLALEGVQMGR
ncbi:MAG: arginine decarboxylase, partial [Lentisphaeraceae bacterium]|nr:arginine decarboxylase [Lentisphaeraceae bacterium]